MVHLFEHLPIHSFMPHWSRLSLIKANCITTTKQPQKRTITKNTIKSAEGGGFHS